MKSTFTLAAAAAALAATLAGCSSVSSIASRLSKGKSSGRQAEVAVPAPQPPVMQLTGEALAGHWYISRVGAVTLHGFEDEWPYLQFEPSEHRFYGSDGCNVLNGAYAAGPAQTLHFSHVAATMRLCPADTLGYAVANALEATRAFSVSTDSTGTHTLSLHNEAHRTVMTLMKSDIEFLNGAWQVVSLDGEPVTNPDVKLVVDVPEGQLHGNTGCNVVNGRITRDAMVPSSVQFSSLATTRMLCPPDQMAVEQKLLLALEETYSAARADGGHARLLAKSGAVLMELAPLGRADF